MEGTIEPTSDRDVYVRHDPMAGASLAPVIPPRDSSLGRRKPKVGSLKVIMSMMYGGKSSYLIHIIETLGYACKILYINHVFDTRGGEERYSTHSITLNKSLSGKLNATMIQVATLAEIPKEMLTDHNVVCIDEGQFFPDLVERVNYMVDVLNLDVYLAGLNGDYRRQRFGNILDMLPNVDDVRMLRDTLCSRCASQGERVPALFTWRIKDASETQIEIGASNYIPVCRGCYNSLQRERDRKNI